MENLLEILTKRRSQTFYNSINVHSVTNVGENISSITKHNIEIQFGKCNFSYGSAVNNLKGRKIF